MPSLDQTRTALLKVVDIGNSKKSHRPIELHSENLQRLDDALGSTRGKAVQVGLTDTDGISTQSQGLADIGTTLHTAVHDNLNVRSNRLTDRGEDVNGGGGGFQLPSTVVGYPHG